jgi:4-diphosphocytidyl-2-C-methyl-D-erythritol kinase
MIVFPIAKINLGLRIVSRRPDGYHNIETIFFPVNLHDALEFVVPEEKNNQDILVTSGIDTGAAGNDNLVIKAAMKLRQRHDFPFLKIHLHKAIPTGAGLGGGSSDAACFLKAVNRFLNLCVPDAELKSIALELGSDCPFFIDGKPVLATSRGEEMKPVRLCLDGYYLVLLNPGVHAGTREAYENCRPGIPETSLEKLVRQPIEDWKSLIYNDFEEYLFMKFPVIGDLKNELYASGALFSLMSGSGSSVYGIFREKPQISEKIRKYVIYESALTHM